MTCTSTYYYVYCNYYYRDYIKLNIFLYAYVVYALCNLLYYICTNLLYAIYYTKLELTRQCYGVGKTIYIYIYIYIYIKYP